MRADGSRPTEGRPTKYKPEFCQAIIDYFTVDLNKTHKKTITTAKGTVIEEDVPDIPMFPSFAGFAAKIGVSKDIISDWQKAHAQFRRSCARAKAMAEEILVRYVLRGDYDSNFARFVAINYTDMQDRSAVEHSGPGGEPLSIQVVHFAALPQQEPPQAIPSTGQKALNPAKNKNL
jgi:hypothetical protein